jgi:methylphosphotriester-DNA--protein-cysteine methyltransferase
MPTPDNLDVFVARLQRADLLVFDPMVAELVHADDATVPERTAQSRFRRAVGVSRRTMRVIERARFAAERLRAGVPIPSVVEAAGYYDQPHLTRSIKRLIGYTPAELARGEEFLNV